MLSIGYFLCPRPAGFTIRVFNAASGAELRVMENGAGGLSVDRPDVGVFRVEMVDANGLGLGWYFRASNVEGNQSSSCAYNTFSIGAP